MIATANLFIQNSFETLGSRAQAALKSLPTVGGMRTIIWVAAGLLLVALVSLVQASNATIIAHNLHLKQAKIQELEMENAQLRFEIARATSPSAIQERAKKVGLGPAKRVVYTNLPVLGEDRVLGVANLPARAPEVAVQPAAAASATAWDQLLTLFGLGRTNRAEAHAR